MQSRIGSHGLPLSVLGFTLSTHSVSALMADHERRREAMRTRMQGSRNMEDMLLEANKEGDLEDFVNGLYETNLTRAAKAA